MRDRLAGSAALADEARRKREHMVSSDGMRSVRSLAIILIVHLAVIVLWQVLVDAFQVPKFILPSPLATIATLTSATQAANAFWLTFTNASASFGFFSRKAPLTISELP